MSSQSLKLNQIESIPNNWDLVNFGDIVDYTKGFAFKSKDYTKNGIRVIRVSDTTFTTIKDEDEIFIEKNNAKHYSKWKLIEDDLVFSTVGSKPPMYDSLVGRVIIIDKKHEGCLLNQNAVIIRIKNKTKLKQILLLNHFRTKRYIEFIEKIYRGNANQASITLKELFKFPLVLPKNQDEQNTIAQILSSSDELIKQIDYLITKRKNIKQGMIQDLLTGKRRLLGFTKDWNTFSFNDAFDITAGGDLDKKLFSKSQDDKHPFPIYSNSLTNSGLYGFSSKFQYAENSITITARGTVGKANARSHKYSAIGRILVLKPTIRLDCFVVAEYINNRIKFSIESTGVPQLTAPQMSKYSIVLPEPDEQSAIAKILTNMDSEIKELETKRDKYVMIKNGMVQKLLTGEIRLT